MQNKYELQQSKTNSAYEKVQKASLVLFPFLLFLYPFFWVDKGIDFSDSTCSMANFVHMEDLRGLWQFGYYLSNVTGSLITQLPFGEQLLGFKLYATLLISITAMISYFFLKKKFPAGCVFLGEVIAISLCWCPIVILYNYLTYFIMTVAVILLYLGLTANKKKFLFIAGMLLGINIMVRMPNVMEGSLILAVWFFAFLTHKKWKEVINETLICLTGYLTGFFSIFAWILLRYGWNAYEEMITGSIQLGNSGIGYSMFEMIQKVIDEFLGVGKIEFIFLMATVLGVVAFSLMRVKGYLYRIMCALYTACLGFLYYLFLKKNYFSTRYDEYGSVFPVVAIFLTMAIFFLIWKIVARTSKNQEKLLFSMVLIVLVITPLGSNNGIFPIMNNMFLIAPILIYLVYEFWTQRSERELTVGKHLHLMLSLFPIKILFLSLVLFMLIQGIGFRSHFTFRDGGVGNPMTVEVDGNERLRGMETTKENRESIMSLTQFIQDEGLSERKLLMLGNIPGLLYILDMESATRDFWLDLESNLLESIDEDLLNMEKQGGEALPLIILGTSMGEADTVVAKEERIMEFIEKNDYELVFTNEKFLVYQNK